MYTFHRSKLADLNKNDQVDSSPLHLLVNCIEHRVCRHTVEICWHFFNWQSQYPVHFKQIHNYYHDAKHISPCSQALHLYLMEYEHAVIVFLFCCGYIAGYCGFMWYIYPNVSQLFHWQWEKCMVKPAPVYKPWGMWFKSTDARRQQNTWHSSKRWYNAWDVEGNENRSYAKINKMLWAIIFCGIFFEKFVAPLKFGNG